MDRKIIAKAIATAVAVAFVAGPLTATQALAHKVRCYGVDPCEGKSNCKAVKCSCKDDSCKGQCYMMKKKKCKKMGGSTEAPTT